MLERIVPAALRVLRAAFAASLAILLVCAIAVFSPVPLLPFGITGIGFIVQMAIVPAVLLIPVMACMATVARGRFIMPMVLGIVVIVVAMTLWWMAIAFFHATGDDIGTRLMIAAAMALSVPSMAIGFAASLFRRPERSRMSRFGAVTAIVGACIGLSIFAIVVVSAVLEPIRSRVPFPPMDWDDRPVPEALAIGIGMLITGLATAAVGQSRRALETAPGGAESFDVAIICPRCEASQVIPSGGAACQTCRLRIVVEAA